MLFEMARFLVCFTAELALIWPVIAHHIQILLESQTGILGWDEACLKNDRETMKDYFYSIHNQISACVKSLNEDTTLIHITIRMRSYQSQ